MEEINDKTLSKSTLKYIARDATMLLVQEFLENHTFKELQEQHGVYASFSKSGHKFSLNYDQIEAKESDPLSQECRGLILSAEDGHSFLSQAQQINGRNNYDHISPGKTKILAYPMKRFFNHGQGSAADINWSDPNLVVLEKLDGCFTYDTLLTCWDGSVLRIGEVVKNKLTPKLIGMDVHGNLVPCEVVNWFNNGKKNNWLEITTSEISKGKNRKFKITSNHSVNINGKFIPIMYAKIGDKLISWEDNICDWTKHFIRSSLLGDATLSKNGKNFKFEEGHKEEHKEFTDQNEKWLGQNFGSRGNYTSGFGSKMIRVSSRPDPIISQLRNEWYDKNGNKILPNDLSWIDDFTIAKWYMDDGSLAHNSGQKDRACFATNNFSEKEVIRLGEKLKEMYGISYTVYFSKGWCLRVNAGRHLEINKLWRAISPYIIPCMKYKLPPEYQNETFINEHYYGLINKIKKEIEIIHIKKISLSNKNNKKNFPHGRVGFDIETTTHNYMANNIIVHNSLCIVYYDWFIKQWCVATRSVPEADLPMDNGIFTFKTLFEKALKDTSGKDFGDFTQMLNQNITYCFELTTPYNRIVVYYPDCRITLLAARSLTDNNEFDLANLGGGMKWVEFDKLDQKTKDHMIASGHTKEAVEAFVSVPFDLVGVPIVQAHTYSSIDDLIDWVSSLNPMEHEGVVVRDSQFNRIKVKNAAYVAASKIREALATSPRNCLELILLGKDDDAASFLPQEIQANLVSLKNKFILWLRGQEVLAQTIIEEARSIAPDKKTFALTVQKHKPDVPAALFAIYDNKANSIKSFIENNRKDGSWGNSFLDKLLELSKNSKA